MRNPRQILFQKKLQRSAFSAYGSYVADYFHTYSQHIEAKNPQHARNGVWSERETRRPFSNTISRGHSGGNAVDGWHKWLHIQGWSHLRWRLRLTMRPRTRWPVDIGVMDTSLLCLLPMEISPPCSWIELTLYWPKNHCKWFISE